MYFDSLNLNFFIIFNYQFFVILSILYSKLAKLSSPPITEKSMKLLLQYLSYKFISRQQYGVGLGFDYRCLFSLNHNNLTRRELWVKLSELFLLGNFAGGFWMANLLKSTASRSYICLSRIRLSTNTRFQLICTNQSTILGLLTKWCTKMSPLNLWI